MAIIIFRHCFPHSAVRCSVRGTHVQFSHSSKSYWAMLRIFHTIVYFLQNIIGCQWHPLWTGSRDTLPGNPCAWYPKNQWRHEIGIWWRIWITCERREVRTEFPGRSHASHSRVRNWVTITGTKERLHRRRTQRADRCSSSWMYLWMLPKFRPDFCLIAR